MIGYRKFILPVLLILAVATGCVIVTADGTKIVDIDPDNKSHDEKIDEKTVEDASPTPPPANGERVSLDDALAEISPNNAGQTAANAADESEDDEEFSAAPWWKAKRIEARDLSDDAGKTSSTPLMPTKEKNETPSAGLLATDISDDEPPPPEALTPADEESPPPAKKIYETDRHLQPIPNELWEATVKINTSPKAAPARRASMDKVQSAIGAGYGEVYVSRLDKAISLDQKNGYAYYFLARGRFEVGDWKGAKEFADKSVQLLGADLKFRACARIILAKALANTGALDVARGEAQKAMTDDPQNTEARILSLKLG